MTDKDWAEDIKRYFDVVAEDLKNDIQMIAEGHTVLLDQIKDFKDEVRIEFKEVKDFQDEVRIEFKEVKSMIKLSYAELDNRVTNLEKRMVTLEKRSA